MKADPVERVLGLLSFLNILVGVANLVLSHLAEDGEGQIYAGVMICLGLVGLAYVFRKDKNEN